MKQCKIYFPGANEAIICDLNLIAIEMEIENYCQENDCIIAPCESLDINFISELIADGHANITVVYDENTDENISLHLI